MSEMSHSDFNPKKILLPMDFSPSSYLALESATALAQRFLARLYLLNVVPILPDITGSEFFQEEAFLQEAMDRAHLQLDSCVTTLTLKGAVSTGRRNIGLKFTSWSFKAQSFPWALVELQSHLVEVGLGIAGQVSFLREVLS